MPLRGCFQPAEKIARVFARGTAPALVLVVHSALASVAADSQQEPACDSVQSCQTEIEGLRTSLENERRLRLRAQEEAQTRQARPPSPTNSLRASEELERAFERLERMIGSSDQR